MKIILNRFYTYQRERFPLVLLGISLLPAALSSGAVVGHSALPETILAILASLAYLLHIRITDEFRDFEHDNIHHRTRPLQTGVISRAELRLIDICAVALLVGIAAWVGAVSLALAFLMLGYVYLAGKEFFLGEHIRRYFFTYNSINLVQMLLLQVFVYSVFAKEIPFTLLVGTHFLFTAVGTIIFEFVRKLKIPGDDGSGKDTYTHYLGFNVSMGVYLFFVFLNVVLFYTLLVQLGQERVGSLSVLGAGLVAGGFALVHWLKKTHQTGQLMQLAFVVTYGVFNLTIYFLVN